MEIPKIIHQIWSSKYNPLPLQFKEWSNSLKKCNTDYEYIYWNDMEIDKFLIKYYGKESIIINEYLFDIQKWDILKYLILNIYGGVYIDFDTQGLRCINDLLKDNRFCITADPHYKTVTMNNSFIASIPNHPFLQHIMQYSFSVISNHRKENSSRIEKVLSSTGPKMINKLFEDYLCKGDVKIIPARYTSPITQMDSIRLLKGSKSQKLLNKLKDAYLIHYFIGSWIATDYCLKFDESNKCIIPNI